MFELGGIGILSAAKDLLFIRRARQKQILRCAQDDRVFRLACTLPIFRVWA